MIVTVTPNPSIDRTVTLGTPLTRGAVHRVTSATSEPGGKGVNVARALTLAGLDAVARAARRRHRSHGGRPARGAVSPSSCVPISGAVRTNLTITEADGTTTKLNEPGAHLDAAGAGRAHPNASSTHAETASWVVLSGSLPPGVPRRLVRRRRRAAGRLRRARWPSTPPNARSTRWRPRFGHAAPDVIKPNAEELAGLVGASAESLETAAAQGDPDAGGGRRRI